MRAVAVHLLLLAIYLLLGGVQADATNNNNIFLSPNIEEPRLASGGIANDMAPTNIIGRDNLCADVPYNIYIDGNPIQLWPCGNKKRNQLWTFDRNDGTIRSNGKCMTVDTPGDKVVIYTCPTLETEDKKPYQWAVNDVLGTITNQETGLVLTAGNATWGTVLSVNVDSTSSSQAWTAVNYTQPIIYTIRWLRGTCLKANGVDAIVQVPICEPFCKETSQQWALYYDRTIRLYSDRSLCVTSNGDNNGDNIILRKCQGGPDQRWILLPDGQTIILNPKAGLVMDVKDYQNVILYPFTVDPKQKWLVIPCEASKASI